MTQSTMNCWEALELLEGIDAGAIAADDPLSKEAQRHLATCQPCQAALPARLKWNAELSHAFADVALPPELEARLAQQLGPSPATTVAVPAQRRSRRWWIAALVTSAALLLFLFWPTSSANEFVTRQQIEANIGCELSLLTTYSSERFQPKLPDSWQTFFELRPELIYSFPPKPPSEKPTDTAALVPFEFRHSTLATPIRGRLVMVPRSRFRDPPATSTFFLVQSHYVGGFDCCVWTEGDWVYLCYVRSVREAGMDELRTLMSESRNFT